MSGRRRSMKLEPSQGCQSGFPKLVLHRLALKKCNYLAFRECQSYWSEILGGFIGTAYSTCLRRGQRPLATRKRKAALIIAITTWGCSVKMEHPRWLPLSFPKCLASANGSTTKTTDSIPQSHGF